MLRVVLYSKGTIEANRDNDGFCWMGWIENAEGKTVAFVRESGDIEWCGI